MIKKTSLILLFFVLTSVFIYGQKTPNPENTKISLITCDPGLELYGKFGHTALRVQDSVQYIDWVFNYGIFDFNKPGFYFKFVKGETDYILGVYSFSHFIEEYKRDDIGVYEQDLNLSNSEKEILIYNLIQNALPEYREYRYNFVFNNCATQPRDQVLKSMSHQIVFKDNGNKESFRFLIQSHLSHNPWASLGINLIFGSGADRIATSWETHFLPLFLMREASKALVYDYKNDTKIKLVSSERVLVPSSTKRNIAVKWYEQPMFWFILYFASGIFISFYKKRTSTMSKLFDLTWMFVASIAGLLILYLMLFSEHPFVSNNLNLLWLNPLYLLPVYMMWKKRYRKFLFYAYLSFVLMILIYLILVMFQFQSVPFDVIPILAIILYRLGRRSFRSGKKLYPKKMN